MSPAGALVEVKPDQTPVTMTGAEPTIAGALVRVPASLIRYMTQVTTAPARRGAARGAPKR